jgi:hypothetical protein
MYSVNFEKDHNPDFMAFERENFNYDIIKHSDEFTQSILNAMWPLFRVLWRSRQKGAMDITVNFDQAWDEKHLSRVTGENFNASFHFAIDRNKEWKMNCSVKFVGPENPWLPWKINSNFRTNFNIDTSWSGSGTWK